MSSALYALTVRTSFAAAHRLREYDGNCERLHGHNYRVAAEVRGPLDESHCVVDFVALRGILRAILDELDHRVLLPTGNPLLRVTLDDQEVLVGFQDRRWVFPRGDCALLPVANITAELLSRHIAERLLQELAERLGLRPEMLRIEVDECYGQSAVCELPAS